MIPRRLLARLPAPWQRVADWVVTIALAVAFVLAFARWSPATRLLAGWDVGVALYLVLVAHMMWQSDVGRKVKLKTAGEIGGRKKFRGQVIAADDQTVRVGAEGGDAIQIPYEQIVRGNLIDEGRT